MKKNNTYPFLLGIASILDIRGSLPKYKKQQTYPQWNKFYSGK